ncbi:MAG: sugar ABC transporter [Alphaproteobacteria bacterium]|nr:sugar ABC transporter [Alphaproteobacteria bacterium]
MLYMVECGFADAAREREWSDWYGGPKLAALLALPGWRSSQRFKAVAPIAAPWLAIHSVPGPAFFTGAAYRNAGGGNFADWGPLITNWSRNLFDGLDLAPAVPEDAWLAVADMPPGEYGLRGIPFTWLGSAGLDNKVPDRGIAILDGAAAARAPAAVRLYRPISPRLEGRA